MLNRIFVLGIAGLISISGAYAQDKKAAGAKSNNFPGVGSFEQWQSSTPEYQAGIADIKAQQYTKAIERINAAIALYPYEYKYFYQLGRATELAGGKLSDAESAYRQALSLKSSDWRSWHRLSNVLYEQKRYSEARDALGSALQLNVPPQEKEKLLTELKTITSVMDGGRPLNMSALSDPQELQEHESPE